MRRLPTLMPLFLLFTACISGPEPGDGGGGGGVSVNLAGRARAWRIPDTDTAVAFGRLDVDVFRLRDVADPSRDIAPGSATSLRHLALQSASEACEVYGCQWSASGVPLADASEGLMVAVSDARAEGQTAWQSTYALAFNANQILDAQRAPGTIAAAGMGYVLPQTSVARLALAMGVSAGELVARGACIGLLWEDRGEGRGYGTGLGGASIVVGPTAGPAPEVIYLNDALTQRNNANRTNQDGVFVLLGAAAPAPAAEPAEAPGSWAVPIAVQNTPEMARYVGNVAVVRPGAITVVPIIPRRT
jgi:hypothetical protein